MMFSKGKTRGKTDASKRDTIVLDRQAVTLESLSAEVKKQNRRFWCLLMSVALIASLIVPYLATAATVANKDSEVFDGVVIPGYSMGGMKLSAYGVDLNSWAKLDGDKFVRSNYGIWSDSERWGKADQVLRASEAFRQHSTSSTTASNMLTPYEKSQGWGAITGRTNHSLNHPDGTGRLGQTNQYDDVSPYRTPGDYSYWDGKTPSSSDGASADITVSLYADFIAVGVVDGKAVVLDSPDSVSSLGDQTLYNSNGIADGKNAKQSNAIPYFVPLNALMNKFGINGADNAAMSTLLDSISKDPSAAQKIASAANESNLLDIERGTTYYAYNSSIVPNQESHAFNPYPYSMVFSCSDGTSTVVSSIYENSEAYVYFSPASVYNQYINIRSEYERLVSDNAKAVANGSGEMVFRCGYYLAEMAILEAYLNEALPQDMTRGYVGPSEPSSVYAGAPGDGGRSSKVSQWINNAEDPACLQRTTYASLMYDVANYVVAGVDAETPGGSAYRLGDTSAIMDTLSTFGYSTANKATNQTGVMRGMTSTQNFHRATTFTPHGDSLTRNAKHLTAEQGYSGLYVAPYYPVQAHKMPSSEKTYRFPVTTSVPYKVMLAHIKTDSFASASSLSYRSDAISNMDTSIFTDYEVLNAEKTSILASQFEQMSSENAGQLNLQDAMTSLKNQSIAINSSTSISGYSRKEYLGKGLTTDETMTAARVDSALLGYESSSMSADNVHDMLDIVSSVQGLRHETWYRFYNPLKSEGQDSDIFLTRTSPAVTTYMPAILVNGYTAAGGNEVSASETTSNASFDYFSVPSLGACLASHSADDCYYGALDYELRSFYSRGFISSVTSSTDIPTVEQYNRAKEIEAEITARSSAIWNDVVTMYVVAKRLAYLETLYDMKYNNAYNAEYIGIDPSLADIAGQVYTDPGEFRELSELTFSAADQSDEYGDSVMMPVSKAKPAYYDIGVENGPLTKVDANLPEYAAEDDKDSIIMRSQTEWLEQLQNGEATIAAKDHNFVNLFNSGSVFNQSTYVGQMQFSVLFSYRYGQKLMEYLDEGGTFYWTDVSVVMQKIQTGGYFTTLSTAQGKFRYPLEVMLYGVAFSNENPDFEGKHFNNREEASAAFWRSVITPSARNISDTLKQLLGDRQQAAYMPEQIQNCLGWATDQLTTVSDESYFEDPSNPVLTISTGNRESIAETIEDGSITNAAQLRQYHAIFNPESGKIEPDEFLLDSTSLTSRMARGVEGTTYLATIQPACYTVTATVQRQSFMTMLVGSVYPYSGICSGRLAAGVNKYASLEAHAIDYTALENGVSGDLKPNSRSRIVQITNQEYAGVNDFVTNLGTVGAFFGEMGTSMLSSSSDVFTEAFFKSDKQTSTSSPLGRTATTMLGKQVSAAPLVITQEPSASTRVFDYESGKLVKAPAATVGSIADPGTPSASANVSVIGPWADNILLDKGYAFYALLQCIGLTIVMVSLIFIAFRNFYAYTVGSRNSGQNIIKAQTQLKVVVPRAIIALFMIGLPPLSPTSTGFQGGAYLLCQALGSVIGYVANIFADLDGMGIMSLWSFGQSALGNDIFSFAAFLIAAVVISAMLLLGAICIIIQSLCLIAFYLTGPIVWALYLWPYGASTRAPADPSSKGVGSFAAQLSNKLSLGPLTAGKVGNAAPVGWVIGYASTACLTLVWSLMMWVAAMLFAGTEGAGASAASSAYASSLQATGNATASAALLDTNLFGLGTGSNYFGVLFMTVIAVLIFLLMWKTVKSILTSTTVVVANTATTVAKGISQGAKDSVSVEVPGTPSPSSPVAATVDIPVITNDFIASKSELAEEYRKFAEAARAQAQTSTARKIAAAGTAAALGATTNELLGTSGALAVGAVGTGALAAGAGALAASPDAVGAIGGAPVAMTPSQLAEANRRTYWHMNQLADAKAARNIVNQLASATSLEEREEILNGLSEGTRKALAEAGVILPGGGLDLNVVRDGLALAALDGRIKDLQSKVDRAETVLGKTSTGEYVTNKMLSSAGVSSVGSYDKLQALDAQTAARVDKVRLSAAALESEAMAIAAGYLNLYKSDGRSDAVALASAGKAIAKVLNPGAEKVRNKQAALAGGRGACGVFVSHLALGELRRNYAQTFGVSDESVPMNIVQAAKAMERLDFQSAETRRRLNIIKPSIPVAELEEAQQILVPAADMAEIVIETKKDEAVAAFLKLACLELDEDMLEKEGMKQFLDEARNKPSIAALYQWLGKSSTEELFRQLNKDVAAEEEVGDSVANMSDFRELCHAVYWVFLTEEMLIDKDLRNIFQSQWEAEDIKVEHVLGHVKDAMAAAHMYLPAYLIDAYSGEYAQFVDKDFSYNNHQVAKELDLHNAMVIDVVYETLKNASKPLSVKEAVQVASEILDGRYEEFNIDCKRQGVEDGESYVMWKELIDKVLDELRGKEQNYSEETVRQLLVDSGDYPTTADAEQEAMLLIENKPKIDALTTCDNVALLRFRGDEKALKEEFEYALRRGSSKLYAGDSGAGKALGGAPKALKPE